MPTFEYKKLVRDNILGMHKAESHSVEGYRIAGKQLLLALIEKGPEEFQELTLAVQQGNTKNIEEEIGDIEELLDAIKVVAAVDEGAIASARSAKRDEKGGFLDGQYIISVTIPDENHPLVAKFRADPQKYPEIL